MKEKIATLCVVLFLAVAILVGQHWLHLALDVLVHVALALALEIAVCVFLGFGRGKSPDN